MRRLTLILPFDIAIYAALPKAHVHRRFGKGRVVRRRIRHCLKFRHRDTESQRKEKWLLKNRMVFLCVSVSLWQIPC